MTSSGTGTITAGRLALAGLAGLAGTVLMTAAMKRLHRSLPPSERYPLPPRELIDRAVPDRILEKLPERARQDLTTTAHFAYGAAAGGLLGLLPWRPGIGTGALYGVAVWAASYLGWIPAVGLLRPATRHPARRNLLMIGVHLVWGAGLAATFRELECDENEAFDRGPARDG